MMKYISRYLIVFLAALTLVGCETLSPSDEEAKVEDAKGTGAQTTGATAGMDLTGDPMDPQSGLYRHRVVYFDFDQSNIKEEARLIIEAHSKFMAAHPGVSVVLEGHADERGTREYNVALGERRANSVRQMMSLNGVKGSQMQTVSYGEERPAAQGHDESAWSLNRRVEFVYQR